MSRPTRSAQLAAGVFAMALFSCGGSPPATLGVHDGRFSACPDRPNCVSSDAGDEAHRVEPFRFAAEPEAAWATLRDVLTAEPRTRIVKEDGRYLHAEATSRLLRFVDDVEFHLRPERSEIAVRSASRVGYSDLGVNRKRIEGLREKLRARGAIE